MCVVQAYFRGARAALKLSKFDLCMSLVSQGRTHDPGAKEWPGLEQVTHTHTHTHFL